MRTTSSLDSTQRQKHRPAQRGLSTNRCAKSATQTVFARRLRTAARQYSSLYCEKSDSLKVNQTKTVLSYVFNCLIKWISPIIPFTAEEAWQSWKNEIDERSLETGTCSSYAVIPIDRAGEPNYLEAKVTLVDGLPGLTCGDAIDPSAEVSGFKSSVVYNNNTACFNQFLDWDRCYELTLTWTWPDHEPEGNITWNMYRIEQKPSDVDLRYIEPIATNLVNVPGEVGTFTQNGTEYDGIMPYRTYYFILTPVDSVGNEYTISNNGLTYSIPINFKYQIHYLNSCLVIYGTAL